MLYDVNVFPGTGAIKLTLNSDKNDTHGDKSFKEKHRLFDFSNYKYSSPDKDEARPKFLFFSKTISEQIHRFSRRIKIPKAHSCTYRDKLFSKHKS